MSHSSYNSRSIVAGSSFLFTYPFGGPQQFLYLPWALNQQNACARRTIAATPHRILLRAWPDFLLGSYKQVFFKSEILNIFISRWSILASWTKRNNLINIASDAMIPTEHGDFRMRVFVDKNGAEHSILSVG